LLLLRPLSDGAELLPCWGACPPLSFRAFSRLCLHPTKGNSTSERFGELLERARGGELDHWADTPRGRLALIIVLDQFSRNIYRGSPLSYSQDEKALKLALEGIDLGMDRELKRVERSFFWLPLGHSEDLALHERSVEHAEEEVANAPSDAHRANRVNTLYFALPGATRRDRHG
jgi:uncharacterized protein (DUF924 family)